MPMDFQHGPDWRQRVYVSVDSNQTSADEPLAALTRQAAETLGLAIADCGIASDGRQAQFSLRYQDGSWQLWPPTVDDAFGRQPLVIDFVEDPRFKQPMPLREPLARAVGLRANRRPLILDLTAGLGRDAWALASTGCQVIAFERHPLVAFLLADALRRALANEGTAAIARRITLVPADVRSVDLPLVQSEIVGSVSAPERVWLLDPMFPERRKSALVKKPMRIFQALVGQDEDADALFAWSRLQTGTRWVVKRPPQAPHIDGGKPEMNIVSGRIRFDCYF